MATTSRTYKKPLTSVQKMRLMRVLNMTRKAILDAALEEGVDGRLERDSKFQRAYVRKHQVHQDELFDHFPFLDIRKNTYASDLLDKVMQDAMYYILNGDTPGGP